MRAVFLGGLALTPLAVLTPAIASTQLTISSYWFPQIVVLTCSLAMSLLIWSREMLNSSARPVWSASLIPAGALVVWSAVSTLVSPDLARSFFGSSIAAVSFTRIVLYVALVFLAAQLIDTSRDAKTLARTLVVSATVVAAVACVQQLLGVDPLGTSNASGSYFMERGFSTMGNPDHLGGFLVVPVVLSAFGLLADRSPLWRILHPVCFAILFTAAVGTLARAVWVGLLVAVLLGAFLLGKALALVPMRRWLMLLGVAGASLALTFAFADLGALSRRMSPNVPYGVDATAVEKVDRFSAGRLGIWHDTAGIILERPLTGVGPGAFDVGWYGHASTPLLVEDPHSLPIMLAATLGIPGLLAYLALVFIVAGAGWRVYRDLWQRRPLHADTVWLAGWLAAMLALQVTLSVSVLSVPVLMQMSVGFAVLLRPTMKAVAIRPSGRRLVAAAAFATSCFLVLSIAPQTYAEFALARALGDGSEVRAGVVAGRVPWDRRLQVAYFSTRGANVVGALRAGFPGAESRLKGLVSELESAGLRGSGELYYAQTRAELLAEAGEFLDSAAYARAAVEAADEALRIMPASTVVRYVKGIALLRLGRAEEAAATLEGYWRSDSLSPEPGIVYAEALIELGREAEARETLDYLAAEFSGDESVRAALTALDSGSTD